MVPVKLKISLKIYQKMAIWLNENQSLWTASKNNVFPGLGQSQKAAVQLALDWTQEDDDFMVL